MSPDEHTLALLLDSPLQSWGNSSRFQRRGTAAHPSKSGVIALLACARGLDKDAPDEERALAPLAALRLMTVRLPHIPQGRPVVSRYLTDYHTIGGRYDDKKEAGSIPRKASGGIFGTVQTWRDYLLDTRFAVFLQGPADELGRCRDELLDPRWGLWLGRKACVPAVPIMGEVHAGLAQAWTWIQAKTHLTDRLEDFDREIEAEASMEPDLMLQDQPLSFARRVFGPRPVMRRLAGDPMPLS